MQGDSWPWKYLSDKMRGESSSWGEVGRLLVPWALLGSAGTQRCAVSTWDTKRPATPFGQTVRSKERYVTLRRGQTSGLWVEFRMELAWAGFEAGSCVAACGPHWSPLQEGVLLTTDSDAVISLLPHRELSPGRILDPHLYGRTPLGWVLVVGRQEKKEGEVKRSHQDHLSLPLCGDVSTNFLKWGKIVAVPV